MGFSIPFGKGRKLTFGTPTFGTPKEGEKILDMYIIFSNGKQAIPYAVDETTMKNLFDRRPFPNMSRMKIKMTESEYLKLKDRIKADKLLQKILK